MWTLSDKSALKVSKKERKKETRPSPSHLLYSGHCGESEGGKIMPISAWQVAGKEAHGACRVKVKEGQDSATTPIDLENHLSSFHVKNNI